MEEKSVETELRDEVILLTTADVKDLREKKKSIYKQITELQAELRYIHYKLEAAAILANGQLDAQHTNNAHIIARGGHNNGIVVSKEVSRIIDTSQAPITKIEIEHKLKDVGFDPTDRSPHYLQILLWRLLKAGVISKDGEYYSKVT